MYESLFQPIKIGTMELKNRLFVPAMSTLTATPEAVGRMCEGNGPTVFLKV